MRKILLLLTLISLSNFVTAQSPVHNKNGYVDNMLYVKFVDDLEIDPPSQTSEIFIHLSAYGYWTRVHQISQLELTKLRRNAEKNLNKSLPDPNTEFHFHLNNPDDMELVKEIMKDLPFLDRLLNVPIPFNTAAPDYQSGETYLTSTNSGIEAEDFWNTYGNRGTGIKVCDIEYGFNENHVDLPNVTIVGPTPEDPFSGGGIDHGTAVLGEIASLNNGTGTTGIATDCQLFFAGAYTNSTYDLESAITYALTVLGAGDVILLEQQIAGPQYSGSGQFGLVPVEWYEPYHDAIVLAIGQNVIVVEAAGNGEQDLDHADYATGNGGHWPFLPGNESGAIIVGAGAVSTGFGGSDIARSRLWFSNYGYAVDVQGNGEAVTTTGYGDLYSAEGADVWYTADFGGTSSASPIVTGAVVLLQSMYKDTTGTLLTPQEMLDLLIATGKPQQAGFYDLSYDIGPLPDVMAAFYTIYVSVGLEENGESQLFVFPNPNNGEFMINSTQDIQSSALMITDMFGKTIPFEISGLGDNAYKVNVGSVANGIYFAQLNVNGHTSVAKLMIRE